MEATTNTRASGSLARQLASLKLVSRLLGHELHATSGGRITLSREELAEIQATIDLFIEEVSRRAGALPGSAPAETQLVTARSN
jgi:hypothetical protein